MRGNLMLVRFTAVALFGLSTLPWLRISTASAVGTEKPVNVVAFANAPGMITITWDHSGEGVFFFVVEQKEPFPPALPDRDKRIWSISGLQPNHTYFFHVCAVYDFNRKCSDEDGVGFVAVSTRPPEATSPRPAPAPPPPSPASPSAQPLPAPVIRVALVRLAENAPLATQITWANPVSIEQFGLLERMEWFRNEANINASVVGDRNLTPLGTSMVQEVYDIHRQPKDTSRYKLCVQNSINRVCSNEVTVAPVEPVPGDTVKPPGSPKPVFPRP
jgi:hypothetical protein